MIKKLEGKVKKLVSWIGIIIILSGSVTTVTAYFVKVYKQVRENRGLTEVLLGALIADFEPVDSLDYIVKLNGYDIKVKLRKVAKSDNTYVFVLNKNLMN